MKGEGKDKEGWETRRGVEIPRSPRAVRAVAVLVAVGFEIPLALLHPAALSEFVSS